MKKLIRVFHSFLDWFVSKNGLIITGIASLLFTIASVTFFVFPKVVISNPGNFTSEEFKVLRNNVLENGIEVEPKSIPGGLRSDKLYKLTNIDSGVSLLVSPYQEASDYYEFDTFVPYVYKETNFQFGIYVADALFVDALVAGNNFSFYIGVELLDLDGKSPVTVEGFSANVIATFDLDVNLNLKLASSSNRRLFIDEKDWPEVLNDMTNSAKKVANDFHTYPEMFGYPNGNEFIKAAEQSSKTVRTYTDLSRLTKYFSPIAVVFISLFVGITCILFSRRKKAKALENVDISVESPETEPKVSKIKVKPENRFEVFLQTHHLRPFLGEWFFRIVGLVLLAVGTLFLTLFAQNFVLNWGEGWNSFTNNTKDFFASLSSLGSFILLIVIIGIISETRRNLHVTAWFFITLAFAYYFMTSAEYFSYEITAGRFGSNFANIAAASMPGNIFLGIGLFGIIGFFLYFDPKNTFVNKTVFRLLSLIPLAIAIVSIVFSYHQISTQYSYVQSYWLRNIFFIRDSSILFLGVAYEYLLFFSRVVVRKRHGDKNLDEYMLSPYIQFQKNICLCLLIVVVTIVFYAMPVDIRRNFGVTSTHAFFFVLIPFFLFYKPSGKDYKTSSTIIYYIIYAILWALPSIPDMIVSF